MVLMVDLTTHPQMCQVCRTDKATYCFWRWRRDGTKTEQWLCPECHKAMTMRTKQGDGDGSED